MLPRHEGIHGGTGGFQSFLCCSQNKCSFINWEKNRGEKGKKKKKDFLSTFLEAFFVHSPSAYGALGIPVMPLRARGRPRSSPTCSQTASALQTSSSPARDAALVRLPNKSYGELDKIWVQQKWLHLEEQGQHHDFQLTSQGCSSGAGYSSHSPARGSDLHPS